MTVELAALQIGDSADTWRDLGFVVEGDEAYVSSVCHMLGGPSPGVTDWSLRGLPDDMKDIDGLAFGLPIAEAKPTPDHPNGVIALDHIVVASPDIGRTIEALEEAGIELRRTRETGRGPDGSPRMQAFFKLGDVILELVGSMRPGGAAGSPPRFYGLAWTVRDLEESARYFGDRLRPAKDAVQPGRRIATLDRNTGGSTVSMAFMTPEPRG